MTNLIDIRRNRFDECIGKEIFEIHPVILGGNPIDPANKTLLSREQHIDAVRYWNSMIEKLRKADADIGSSNIH